MNFKRVIALLLAVMFVLQGIPTFANETEGEMIDESVISSVGEIEDLEDELDGSENIITDIEPEGTLYVDDIEISDDLDGGDTDWLFETEDAVNELEASIIPDDISFEEITEDELDGALEEVFDTTLSDATGEQVVEGEEVEEVSTEDEGLDGGSAPTGYSMSIESTKVKVGNSLSISFNIRNANYATLYCVCGSSTYTYRVYSGTYRLTFGLPGTWRLYLKTYNNYGSFNGYYNSRGSLYVNAGYAPTGYNMSISKTSSKVNQPIYLYIDYKNADYYYLVILKDGKQYYNGNHGKSTGITFRPNQPGTYKFYLKSYNSYGSYDGSRYSGKTLACYVTGNAPTAYSLSANSSSVNIGSKLNFSISNWGGATSAKIVITRDSTVVATGSITDAYNGFSFTPDKAGSYKCYMITYNSYGSYNGLYNGRVVYFKANGAPAAYDIRINKSSIKAGEKVTLIIDPKNASYYYLVILKNGTQCYKQYHGLARGIDVTLNATGTYKFYLITYNSSGSYNGQNSRYVTCSVSAANTLFTIGKDNYRFTNSGSVLGYSDNEKISLSAYQSVFGSWSGYLKWLSADSWGGSCFGFASSSALMHKGNISYKKYNSSANCTYDLSNTSSVINLLERYQLSQDLTKVSNEEYRYTNKYASIINAVQSYQNGSKDPVIIGIYRNGGGHAVVGRYVTKDSSGNYRIYVSDNNKPTNNNLYITIYKNLNGFYYNNGSRVYSKDISMNYASTIFNAMPSAAKYSLDGTENSTNEEVEQITIALDADEFDIVNSSGTPFEEIENAYEKKSYDDITLSKRIFVLPKDEYTITFKNYEEKETNCLIDDGNEFLGVRSVTKEGALYVGTEATVGKIRCIMSLPVESTIVTEYLNASEQLQQFEINGKYLNLGVSSNGDVIVNTDVNTIKQNGVNVDLSSFEEDDEGGLDGASGSFSGTTLSNNLDGLDGFDGSASTSLSMILRDNTISRENGTIKGKLGIAIKNDLGYMIEGKAYIAAYDSSGKLLTVNTDEFVAGKDVSYFTLDIPDTEILTTDTITIKVFLWDEDMSPMSNALVTSI